MRTAWGRRLAKRFDVEANTKQGVSRVWRRLTVVGAQS